MKGKQKASEPSPGAVPSRDVLQRMSYLYQASSHLASTLSNNQLPLSTAAASQSGTKPVDRALSVHLSSQIKAIAKKAVLKVDPSVKRKVCKGCSTVLIPGATCSVAVKGSGAHSHKVVSACNVCGYRLRIPAPPLKPPATTDESHVGPLPKKSWNMKLRRKGNTREAKDKRRERSPVFFERAEHVIYAGDKRVQ